MIEPTNSPTQENCSCFLVASIFMSRADVCTGGLQQATASDTIGWKNAHSTVREGIAEPVTNGERSTLTMRAQDAVGGLAIRLGTLERLDGHKR